MTILCLLTLFGTELKLTVDVILRTLWKLIAGGYLLSYDDKLVSHFGSMAHSSIVRGKLLNYLRVLVSDIAIFVLKRDFFKLQLTNSRVQTSNQNSSCRVYNIWNRWTGSCGETAIACLRHWASQRNCRSTALAIRALRRAVKTGMHLLLINCSITASDAIRPTLPYII